MADEPKPVIFTEGKPVASMTTEEAKIEIEKTFQDPAYIEGKGIGRERRIKRMGELHRKAYPELVEKEKEAKESGTMNRGLFDYLTDKEITKESLEADEEKRLEEANNEAMAEARKKLDLYFGGEKEAGFKIQSAKKLLKQFAKPDDLVLLEESGLGNDPELIKKLAEIQDILERARRVRK